MRIVFFVRLKIQMPSFERHPGCDFIVHLRCVWAFEFFLQLGLTVLIPFAMWLQYKNNPHFMRIVFFVRLKIQMPSFERHPGCDFIVHLRCVWAFEFFADKKRPSRCDGLFTLCTRRDSNPKPSHP